MSTLHERRDQIGVAEIETQLANLELKEPLTQTPGTPDSLPSPEPPSPEARDDEKANPHIAQEEAPSHECARCLVVFLCHGDRNGNRVGGAADLCDCTQAIEDLPVQHLVFYCSDVCERLARSVM